MENLEKLERALKLAHVKAKMMYTSIKDAHNDVMIRIYKKKHKIELNDIITYKTPKKIIKGRVVAFKVVVVGRVDIYIDDMKRNGTFVENRSHIVNFPYEKV